MWDVGYERKARPGWMPRFKMGERRSKGEFVEEKDKLSLATPKNLIGVGTTINLLVPYGDSNDILRRITVFYFLAYFLEELTLEQGLDVKSEFEEWIGKDKPTENAIIFADNHLLTLVHNQMGEGNYGSYTEAFDAVRNGDGSKEKPGLEAIFTKAILQCGHYAGIVAEAGSGVVSSGLTAPAATARNAEDGSVVQPGTFPASHPAATGAPTAPPGFGAVNPPLEP